MTVASIENASPRSSSTSASVSALRVLQLINGEHYAGAERVQDLLALRLPNEGIQTSFACLKPDRFIEMRQSVDTALFEVPMRSRADIRAAWRVASLVRREACDVLHTHGARALFIGSVAAELTGVPLVHHVHGNTSSEVRGRRFARLNALTERLLLSRAERVIAVSPSVADYLKSAGVQTERIALIPNGVPSRRYDFDRRAEHWPPVLGFVGLLRPRKGLEVLLEAARLLQERGNQFNLRIVGRFEESGYQRQIGLLAETLGLSPLIEWRGFRREVDRELDCMSLLVFPSILPEGMPMVLLEAMAAGVPIVASDIEGVRGLLTHEGHALLIPPEDPEALARSIERLLKDAGLHGRLQRAAFDLQTENYSDTSMAASVAEIYQQVVAATR
jgi:glycosyltransferase involved in cell wall biosynthesis